MASTGAIRRLLATLPGRVAHGIYLSRKHSRRAGQPVRVRFRSGWVFEYRNGTLPAGVHKSPDELERDTVDYFCWGYRPAPGDVVVDVGAGSGTEVLAFSRMVGPAGRVYALEAHPASFRLLERVVALNTLSNVVPVRVALGEHVGTVKISTVEHNVDSHSIVNAATFAASDVTVPATTLDSFVVDYQIDRIDLLKMNIEGAEALVIRAAAAAMARIERVAISCHDFVADDGRGGDEMRTREQVLAFLQRHGYRVESRDDDPRAFVRSYLYGARARQPVPATPGDRHP